MDHSRVIAFFKNIKKIDGPISFELFQPGYSNLPMVALIGDYHTFDTRCLDQKECVSLYDNELFRKIDSELQTGDLLVERGYALPGFTTKAEDQGSALIEMNNADEDFCNINVHWGDLRFLVGNENLQVLINLNIKYAGDAISYLLRSLIGQPSLTVSVRETWIGHLITLFPSWSYAQLKQIFLQFISQSFTFDMYTASKFFRQFGRMYRELSQVAEPIQSFIRESARQEFSQPDLFYWKELTEFVSQIDDYTIPVLNIDRDKVKMQLTLVTAKQRVAMDVYSISRLAKFPHQGSPLFMLYFGQTHINSMRKMILSFYTSVVKFYSCDFKCLVADPLFESTDLIMQVITGQRILDDLSLFNTINSTRDFELYFKNSIILASAVHTEQRKRVLAYFDKNFFEKFISTEGFDILHFIILYSYPEMIKVLFKDIKIDFQHGLLLFAFQIKRFDMAEALVALNYPLADWNINTNTLEFAASHEDPIYFKFISYYKDRLTPAHHSWFYWALKAEFAVLFGHNDVVPSPVTTNISPRPINLGQMDVDQFESDERLRIWHYVIAYERAELIADLNNLAAFPPGLLLYAFMLKRMDMAHALLAIGYPLVDFNPTTNVLLYAARNPNRIFVDFVLGYRYYLTRRQLTQFHRFARNTAYAEEIELELFK